MGFIRRFGYFPGNEVISQIEGAVIVDLPPPGAVRGVGVGTAVFIGEAADMRLAVEYNTAGVLSTLIQPTEIFGPVDLIDKIGGFDDTLGDHGNSLGNLFLALRNKRFSRLIVAVVNQASAQGSRYFRELPLCASQTDTTPVVPVVGATIDAGREFSGGTAARLRVAGKVEFSANLPFHENTAGVCVAGASAATQVFQKAGFDWTTDVTRPDGSLGAKKGDILVIGNNNAGAKQPTAEAGTYRVFSDPSSGTDVTIQRLDGANFTFTAQSNVPFRLHRSPDADSAPERVLGSAVAGGYDHNDNGAFIIPIRPLTNDAGAQSDGTITAASLLTPLVVPTAMTGDSWDPLSGLQGMLHPTTDTAFTVASQGINPVSSATIDALYATALDALISEEDPMRSINIVVAARKSATIRTALKAHVLESSGLGRGRVAVISPNLQTTDILNAVGDSSPGVGATRDERVFYSWPGCIHSVPEAVNTLIATADQDYTDDGILDDSYDHWLASLLSVLPPERNPGQTSEPVPTSFASVAGLQRGVSGLGISQYTLLKQKGIAALRVYRSVGPIIQSGVTSSLISGKLNINRRRMADFIQDSWAEAIVNFSKEPLTEGLKDEILSVSIAFFEDLKSVGRPASQRINDYKVDDISGNTPDLEAQGIYVLIGRVRTLATADYIVLQTEIGEGVTISEL